MSAARWVCDHWIETWFKVRHTGGYGHTARQCRSHVRYWIGVRRAAQGGK